MKMNKKPIKIFYNEDTGGGDGGAPAKEDSPFSGTMVTKKDPVTGDEFQVPVELESRFGHFISKTRSEIESKYKPIVEKLQGETSELEEVKAELEKIRQENMTAEEKAQEQVTKKIKEFEGKANEAIEESQKWKSQFFSNKITTDIMQSFGKASLNNPQQTALIFQQEGNAKVEEILDEVGKGTGRYETRMTVQITNDKGEPVTIEGTPSELFERWINEDRNLHHLKNQMNPGGGSGKYKVSVNSDNTLDMSAERRLDYAHQRGQA